MAQITAQGTAQGTALKGQAQTLQHELAKLMRGFGRQCRGQGKVLVSVVRQTETHLLATGDPVVALAQTAQAQVQSAAELTEEQRARWDTTLPLALVPHQQIATHSRRLTHGKPLTCRKLVNAYAPPVPLSAKGRATVLRRLAANLGLWRSPPRASCSPRSCLGNPSDASYVLPLVAKVQTARSHVPTRPTPAIHSRAGDLALNDATLRETLHACGILPLGIPRTVEPLSPTPTSAAIHQVLTAAGLSRNRTPRQV
jgi:hypothetical protein